jgi:intracellular multiplication protein IcmD
MTMKLDVKQGAREVQPLMSLLMYFSAILALFCLSNFALAGSIGDVSDTVAGSMESIGKLITGASYVAGIGFALLGLLKLKAHKDNATQVPLSQPIVLLVIAAGLVFLPSIISTAGDTIWGDSGGARGGATGGGMEME